MTMGEYIKKLRKEKDLSQEELGQLVGVNRAAVNKWEQGTVENIKRSTIKKLSQIFNVSPCEIMCWEEELTDSNTNENPFIIEMTDEKMIITDYRQLNEYGKDEAQKRIRELTELPKYQLEPKITLLAAHERTDIETTDQDAEHDLQLMLDPKNWE